MPNDTDPAIDAMLVEAYRKMSPADKLRRVAELNRAIVALAAAGVRQRQGPISERELELRVASLWLDRATMVRAFGWDPEEHGR